MCEGIKLIGSFHFVFRFQGTGHFRQARSSFTLVGKIDYEVS